MSVGKSLIACSVEASFVRNILIAMPRGPLPPTKQTKQKHTTDIGI